MTVEKLLAQARARIAPLSSAAAYRARQDGAVLVDIRPHAFRAAEGEIPGALVVEHNVTGGSAAIP